MKPAAAALLTDLYQLTMAQAYFDLDMHESAVFELFVRRLPHAVFPAGRRPRASARVRREPAVHCG